MILVTGASSGIGRATALLFAGEGEEVLATGRSVAALEALEENCRALPGELRTLSGDLTDPGFRAQLADNAARAGDGKLDALINAAGIIASDSVESTSLEDFDRMMDINVRSLLDLTQCCLESIKAARGSIVNVSSVTGTRAFPGVLSYCVSKAAVDQLTRCMALDLAQYGVRVNAVNPGVVRTNLHRNGGMDEQAYAAFVEKGSTTHPLGRIGEPEEVAELIAFLAGPRSGWITGECVAIDGGRAQTCAR